MLTRTQSGKKERQGTRREVKRMEDDFERRRYANKSGQEREDEAKRRALRGQMEWQDGCGEESAFQGTEGKLVEGG